MDRRPRERSTGWHSAFAICKGHATFAAAPFCAKRWAGRGRWTRARWRLTVLSGAYAIALQLAGFHRHRAVANGKTRNGVFALLIRRGQNTVGLKEKSWFEEEVVPRSRCCKECRDERRGLVDIAHAAMMANESDDAAGLRFSLTHWPTWKLFFAARREPAVRSISPVCWMSVLCWF